jgi:hypothetical protein
MGKHTAKEPGQDELVSEPLIQVPVPGKNWVVIVVSDGERYAACEMPRAAFDGDSVMARTFQDMDEQMGKKPK